MDSILGQTYEHFECLLINDGSSDNSEYVSKDARFKYFEKENGGVASARNLGIECSGGVHYFCRFWWLVRFFLLRNSI